MSTFLWAVFPYIALLVFAGGLVWRYRNDKFGWTTRSSQIYESKLLRIGGPMFHFGILMAIVGHAMGLIIPKLWTDKVIDQHGYHMMAVGGGITAGVLVSVGFLILAYRRFTVKTVRNATTASDKLLYLVLAVTIFFGMWNTISTALSDAYNYREGVSPWFRSIFTFQPDAGLIADAPFQFQAHAFMAFVIILILPFTRLVHILSAPVFYLTRPYIVFRSRGASVQSANPSAHAPKGTWAPPTTPAASSQMSSGAAVNSGR